MYKIKQWNAILASNHRRLAVSIAPTLEFMRTIENNGNEIIAKIVGSGTCYDGIIMRGVVNRGGFNNNCRPDYCSTSGDYVITFEATWLGYAPDFNNLGALVLL